MNFAPRLQLLLLALIVGSSIFFCLRFARILSLILRAKPEIAAGSPWPRRLWRLFWEVLCQAKIIRERPLAGLAHGFLVWGFVAFLAAEINHLALGFDRAFISDTNILGLFYSWFVFLFCLGSALAILILVVRRYIARRYAEWLDPSSAQTALTLLLIFLLMATTLPRHWIVAASLAGTVLWWGNTIVLLALLPLMARSKNIHALLSPFALFFKRDGFSQIPALEHRHDRGLVNGRDITRIAALQSFSCVECGRCTEQCPATNTGQELDPRLIPLGLSYYLEEFGPAGTAPILGDAISAESIWQCTTCGACEDQCPNGIQHLPMILGLRRAAVNSGAAPEPHAAQLFANLSQYGNAAGMLESERQRFVNWLNVPIFDGTQDYCLWLGCMGAYDERGRQIITSFVDVMQHLGTSFGVLRKESCTGDAARRLGNDAVVSHLAKVNLQTLQQSGVKKIVSICPHCVRTIAEDWNQMPGTSGPNAPIDATIEHHSEFLARHAHLLPAVKAATAPERTVYHDPCYLGRYRHVYDEPRQIVARSAELLEAPRARERSFCCGAGGGLVFLGPETGQGISRVRASELAATGAQVIATACPFCQGVLAEALPASEASPRLLDIAQIAAASIQNQGG